MRSKWRRRSTPSSPRPASSRARCTAFRLPSRISSTRLTCARPAGRRRTMPMTARRRMPRLSRGCARRGQSSSPRRIWASMPPATAARSVARLVILMTRAAAPAAPAAARARLLPPISSPARSARRPDHRRAIPPPTTPCSASSRRSLISRAGLIPASLTRDRPGILCKSVKDAATVLSAVAGYDPKDAATAASVGQTPAKPYEDIVDGASLRGVRIGVVREFMRPHTKADEDSIAIAERAIADLKKAGAIVVDPGPGGALFKEAIAELLPSLDTPTLSAVYKEEFSAGTTAIGRSLEMAGHASSLPAELTLRVLAEREPPTSGEGLFALERYLLERGDKNIRSVSDLVANSTFYTHAPISGVTPVPKGRLEGFMTRTERFTKKSDGSSFVRNTPINTLDVSQWHANRTVLQMLVNKVMADHKLDALVYPTKTIPAPRLAEPVEPTN